MTHRPEEPTSSSYSVDAVTLRQQLLAPEALNLFASLFLGDTFRVPFPPAMEAYWALLVRGALSGEQELRYALGLPRGFAKTTLIKLFQVWLLPNTRYQFCLTVSANASKGEKIVADICDMLDSPNFRAIYGNWRADMAQDTQSMKIFTAFGKANIIAAIGAEGSVRGLNVKNRRPDVIILEDAQEKESAESKVQNSAFIEWFLGTLYLARSYERSICVFIGNMYNKECCLNQLRQSPDWVTLISAGILRNGESLWPALRTKESLLADYRQAVQFNKAHIFLAEVMNDPDAAPLDFFDSTKVRPYAYPLNLPPDGAFIVIDPATGKKTGDNTVLGLFYVIDGKPILREIRAGKWADLETIEEGLDLASQHPVSLVAIEAVAYQITLAFQFERVMQQRGLSLRIQPFGTGGIPKSTRIKSALTAWLAGETDIHPDVRPIILSYIARYNPLKKDNEDDELDVFAYGNPVLSEYYHMIETPSLHTSDSGRVLSVHETSCF